mgnify:FL=1
MKLNLGCGNRVMDGYVNIDFHPASDKVQQGDITELCYPSGSVEHIIIFHTLEHLTKDQAEELIVAMVFWLTSGGILEIEMPDRAKCIKCMEEGRTENKGRSKGGIRNVGASGILGGAPHKKVEYHTWVCKNAELILEKTREFHYFPQELIPEEFMDIHSPVGWHHRYIWTEQEIIDVLESIGTLRTVVSEIPTTHGRRAHRDMRVVARK